jgi:hypothetical protein
MDHWGSDRWHDARDRHRIRRGVSESIRATGAAGLSPFNACETLFFPAEQRPQGLKGSP